MHIPIKHTTTLLITPRTTTERNSAGVFINIVKVRVDGNRSNAGLSRLTEKRHYRQTKYYADVDEKHHNASHHADHHYKKR